MQSAANSQLPKVLAIHAHPDDIELQCAGTLLRLRELGCEVAVATMTAGDCGSAIETSAAISAIRKGEAAAAAAILGASYTCLEFKDLSIIPDNESRQKVTEFIRRTRPDIVLTAPPVDYMSDHEFTSRLVRDACFNASVPLYRTHQWEPAPPSHKIPHLYYVDPIAGTDIFGVPITPHCLIDVSDVFEKKIAMLACHASQRDWLRLQHGLDEYLDGCRRWGASRGQAARTQYAEAFTQHRGHPYPHDDVLVALLGGKAVQE